MTVEFLIDRVAESLYHDLGPPGPDQQRAPWREAKWQEAARRVVEIVSAGASSGGLYEVDR